MEHMLRSISLDMGEKLVNECKVKLLKKSCANNYPISYHVVTKAFSVIREGKEVLYKF